MKLVIPLSAVFAALMFSTAAQGRMWSSEQSLKARQHIQILRIHKATTSTLWIQNHRYITHFEFPTKSVFVEQAKLNIKVDKILRHNRLVIKDATRRLSLIREQMIALRAWRAAHSIPYGICSSCWDGVADCESHQNWSVITGNGFYWGLQWVPSTWNNAANLANKRYGLSIPDFDWFMEHRTAPTREQQITAASTLSLGNWPVCQSRY